MKRSNYIYVRIGFLMGLSSSFSMSISPRSVYLRAWSGAHRKVGFSACTDTANPRQGTFRFLD